MRLTVRMRSRMEIVSGSLGAMAFTTGEFL